MSTPANQFPYHYSFEVIFRDLDALGHVNNAVFFTYFESIRIKYLNQFMDFDEALVVGLPVIAAEATCSYRSPAFFGETLHIGAGIARFGHKSFDIVYRIDGEDGRLVATGKTVMVMYDYQQGRSVPVPASFKSQVEAFQGEWQPRLPPR